MANAPNRTGRASADVYAETRDELIALVRSIDAEQLEASVPSCPGWSVKDVVAHVCGIVEDILEANLSGLGTDAWTAAQVDSRSAMTSDEVCREWEGHSDALHELLLADDFMGMRLTGDLIVHVHDIHETLGTQPDKDSTATRIGAHRYVPPVQERVAEQLEIALHITLTDGSDWEPPNPEAARMLRLRATPYDFLRSVTGRRSRSQVMALDWTGDPGHVLDTCWTSYGPLRDESGAP